MTSFLSMALHVERVWWPVSQSHCTAVVEVAVVEVEVVMMTMMTMGCWRLNGRG